MGWSGVSTEFSPTGWDVARSAESVTPGSYRGQVINPGTRPLDDTSEDQARANLDAYLQAAQQRRGSPVVAGDPVRDPGLDRDGRYGWQLPTVDGPTVLILMPGVDLAAVRDDLTAEAPCVYLNGSAWWWTSAVGMLAATARWGAQQPGNAAAV